MEITPPTIPSFKIIYLTVFLPMVFIISISIKSVQYVSPHGLKTILFQSVSNQNMKNIIHNVFAIRAILKVNARRGSNAIHAEITPTLNVITIKLSNFNMKLITLVKQICFRIK